MWKMLWGVMIAAPVIWGLWLLGQQTPLLSPRLLGVLLFIAGGMIGLRVGSDSATRLLKDILRLNNFLAEQNSALAEQNHRLLKKLIDSADAP